MKMNKDTVDICLHIAEDVKLRAKMVSVHLSYGELYGEQCKIEAADEIIDRIKKAAGLTVIADNGDAP